ncbi:hypothetical protein LEN_1008 [Lysobacter enzymogenes]|uniref:Uncharacterized protein n=1 Tax=Lysobacter enzymogenes TaxID=69 RepID=A0AAU9AC55_LYSEN|nr:hypothetical protein LEN_1008 [Lysobacter enzymogenes]
MERRLRIVVVIRCWRQWRTAWVAVAGKGKDRGAGTAARGGRRVQLRV